jgi:very-short-patch-repair endonuclease
LPPPLRKSNDCCPLLAKGGQIEESKGIKQGIFQNDMRTRHKLSSHARELRNNATDVERILWQNLRDSKLEGIKFRRQQPIEDYIVDFVSFSPKLIIEVDGSQHSENQKYDEKRDQCLRNNGFVVLRFWNNEVLENIEGVLEVIRQRCLRGASPTP